MVLRIVDLAGELMLYGTVWGCLGRIFRYSNGIVW